MRSIFDRIFDKPVYIHLLAAGLALCVIVYIAIKWTDAYTRHNQAVRVPDVRGMQVDDAAPFFAQQQLSYTVVDSVYTKDVQPGAIVDLLPEANSKVKKNRTIYITINAKTEETIALPEIVETSFRQAYALLKARGFGDVASRYVPGEYRDLTVGVEYEGREIKGGDRVPLTAKLTLLISDGYIQPDADGDRQDSVEIITGDESWF